MTSKAFHRTFQQKERHSASVTCVFDPVRGDAVQHITDSGEVISCDVSAVHEFPEPYVDHAVFVECYNRF